MSLIFFILISFFKFIYTAIIFWVNKFILLSQGRIQRGGGTGECFGKKNDKIFNIYLGISYCKILRYK